MARQVAADELRVAPDAVEPIGTQHLAHRMLEQRRLQAADQLPDGRPVDQADAGFQRTRPVGTEQIRVLDEPALQQRADAFQIARVAGDLPGLGKTHQFQMTVGLPQILDVAALSRIAEAHLLAVAHRQQRTVVRVAVPLRRKAECHRIPGKQPPLPGQHFVGPLHGEPGLIRQLPRQPAGPDAVEADRRHLGRCAAALHGLTGRGTGAAHDFGNRHAAQPVPVPPHVGQARHLIPCSHSTG